MSFHVRDMDVLDIRECTKIVFDNYDADIAYQARDEMYEMFLTPNTRWPPHYYVAVDDETDKIIGFAGYRAAWLMSHTYELIWINVSSNYQGQGVGKVLTERRLQDIAFNRGSLVLLMTQKPGFFEQFGFKTVEHVDGWMLMLKQLSPLKLGQRP